MKRHAFKQPLAIAQMIRTDARETPAAVKALEELQARRPLKPPGRDPYSGCKPEVAHYEPDPSEPECGVNINLRLRQGPDVQW